MSNITDSKSIRCIKTNSRTFPEFMGKIELGLETKQILDQTNSKIIVEFTPDAQTPTIMLVDEKGDRFAKYEDLVSIGGYRRFLKEARGEAELERLEDEKLKELEAARSLYREETQEETPEHMLKPNWARFNTILGLKEIVQENIGVVDGLVGNDEKKTAIMKMCRSALEALKYELAMCCGPQKVTKEDREGVLSLLGVPNWLFGKLSVKNSISDQLETLEDFLSPRNFTKGFALTTKELSSKEFIEANRPVLNDEDLIFIKVITKLLEEREKLFKEPETQDGRDKLKSLIEGFKWNMSTNQDLKAILEDKIGKKGFCTFTKYVHKGNPGDAIAVAHNMAILQMLNFSWNAAIRFQIDLVDPIDQFWSAGFDVSQWEITPTKNIYNWIKEDPEYETKLKDLVSRKNGWKQAINRYIIHKLDTYIGPKKTLLEQILNYKEDLVPVIGELKEGEAKDASETTMEPTAPVEIVETNEIVDNRAKVYRYETRPGTFNSIERSELKKYAGIKSRKDKKPMRRSLANRGRVTPEILNLMNEIEELEDKILATKVREWLTATFATNSTLMQVAAELVTNAVIEKTAFIDEEGIDEDQDND